MAETRREPKYETQLDFFNQFTGGWEYEDSVLIQSLTIDPINQIRTVKLDTDIVNQYVVQVQSGNAVLPAVVTTKGGVVTGGFHTLSALEKLGKAFTAVYRLNTDDIGLAIAVAAATNQTSGIRLRNKEAKSQLPLYRKLFPNNPNLIASMLGIDVRTIRKSEKAEEVIARAEKISPDLARKVEKLPDSKKTAIDEVPHDEPFTAAVDLATKFPQLKATELRDIAKAAKEAPEQDSIEIIEEKARKVEAETILPPSRNQKLLMTAIDNIASLVGLSPSSFLYAGTNEAKADITNKLQQAVPFLQNVLNVYEQE